MNQPTFDHAIVIGGSVAGLCIAQVLSEHFARVTVLERDTLPADASERRGAPQSRHPHALFLKGLQDMAQLFPGLDADLREGGAAVANLGRDMVWLIKGRWRNEKFDSALNGMGFTRPLLEHALRTRVRANPRITLRAGCEVTALHANADRTRVTAVEVRDRHDQSAAPLAADFVVDASGRESNAPEWLAALGLVPPVETTISARPGYATRLYERVPNQPWQLMYVMPNAPDTSRGVIIMPVEGNRWHVSLIGMNGDYPPTDEAGFMDFLRSLPVPEPYDVLSRARPLGAPVGFRQGDNRLRHFDQMPRHIDNFVAFGDAVYALNPVYGQGMTVAAGGAVMLRDLLRKRMRGARAFDGLAADWQKTLMKVIMPAWMMATGEDTRWLGAEAMARLDPVTRLLQRYIARVLVACTRDIVVAEAFFHVQQMLRTPFSLLAPRIFVRVMREPKPAARALAQQVA